MQLRDHKTKIVATIGPASESPEMLERLIRAGLDIARLNFSHGGFQDHGERIARIRAAERAAGRPVTIMADMPGPKMRLGKIDPEPIASASLGQVHRARRESGGPWLAMKIQYPGVDQAIEHAEQPLDVRRVKA